MTENMISQLDSLLKSKGPLLLPPAMLNLIAHRLEEAIADPRQAPIASLSKQLTEAVRHALTNAPSDVVAGLRSRAKSSHAAVAYVLGQLSLAEAVASTAAGKRADDGFVDALKSEAGRKIASALLNSDVSSGELAEILGERAETISRRLTRFRELGICDFRKDGTTVYNFLTPAARALAESMNLRTGSIPKPNKRARQLLEERTSDLPELWDRRPNFGYEEVGSDEAANLALT